MRHLKPWVCDHCKRIIRDIGERRVVSLDAMSPAGQPRYRRIQLAQLCDDCVVPVYERAENGMLAAELRP